MTVHRCFSISSKRGKATKAKINMKITIRNEQAADINAIIRLIESAFQKEEIVWPWISIRIA